MSNINFLMKVRRMSKTQLLGALKHEGIKISRRTLYTRLEGKTDFKYTEILALMLIFNLDFETLFDLKP